LHGFFFAAGFVPQPEIWLSGMTAEGVSRSNHGPAPVTLAMFSPNWTS
jgi:hypothetical protein